MIREAGPEDADLIAEEFWYPLATEMEPYSELNELTADALEQARAGFAEVLTDDDRYDFLLERDGTAVGHVSVEIGTRPTRKLGKYLAVLDLYVKEGFRGQGHGTRLLRRVETLAEDEDCDFVRVAAEWDNAPARAFYERHGYEPKQAKYTGRLR